MWKKLRSKLFHNLQIVVMPIYDFSVYNNSLGGQFWAMGKFNLLGGHLPTQLTCYLPPSYHHYSISLLSYG